MVDNAGAEASARLGGIDAARGLAIVGMVAVHFAPRPMLETSTWAWLLGVPYGKASILFAVVAGVGVSLLAQRRPELLRLRLLYRAAWLLPLGLVLQELEHPVAVILQYYAVWFLFAALFVAAADRVLLAVASVGLLAGSVAVAWVGIHHLGWLRPAGGAAPGGVPRDLLLAGYYPTITWLPVVLFGMWLGRRDLRSPRVRAWMIGLGAAVAAVAWRGGLLVAAALDLDTAVGSWGRLLSIDGHSEMPLSVLGATALAVAVLGAALTLVERLPRATRPVVAMGQGALSIYVAQLVIWPIWPELFESSSVAEAWTVTAWFTVLSAAAMTLWLLVFRRGPLEATVRAPWERAIVPMARIIRGESLVQGTAAGAPGGPDLDGPAPPGAAPRSG